MDTQAGTWGGALSKRLPGHGAAGRLLGLQQLEPRINGDIIGESNDFYLNTLALIFMHTGVRSHMRQQVFVK